MHIRIHREPFLSALAQVVSVVEKRQTLPILSNLLLEAPEEGLIQLTGTDSEIEIRTQCAGTVEKPGQVTLPAHKLIGICRALPAQTELSLRTSGSEEQRLMLTAGKSRFRLGMLPPEAFPRMEEEVETQAIALDQSVLRELLEKTAFAMANHDVRVYLNGLFLQFGENRATAVATDGHRLAKLEKPWSGEELVHGILPRKTVLELVKLLKGGEAPVRIALGERLFRVFGDQWVFTSKLLEGTYPDYQRVIPPAKEPCARIDRESFRQALRRAAILSNEKYKGVRLTFLPGKLFLQTNNPEQEEAEEELAIQYEGEEITIGFNVGYLLDILNTVEEPQVLIYFSDTSSPALFRGEHRPDEAFVVMPMRI